MSNDILPLEGIRVIDITTAWAGPVAAMFFADLGAEVIKVEGPNKPDVTRLLEPFADFIPGINRSGYHAFCNRGKKSLIVDLKTSEGVITLKKLVKISDVLIENFPPRVMDGLGLGYKILHAINPRLIMISESGYGATGPDKEALAYGPVLEAYAGLSMLIGYPGRSPLGSLVPISDQTSATSAAFAALAALHYRDNTGKGQHVDVSETETLIACLSEAFLEYVMTSRLPLPRGNRDEVMAPHGCYRCKGEDSWISIAVSSDEEWVSLCQAIGKPQLADDERFADGFLRWNNQDALDKVLAEWAGEQDQIETFQTLQRFGVCAGPAYNNEQLHKDSHLLARQFFAKINHPEVGERDLPGIFAKFSLTPGAVRQHDPLFGEHTDWVVNVLLKDVVLEE